jgi:hypothetical protein
VLRSCCSANVHAPCSHSLTLLPCSSNRWFPCGWLAIAAEQKLVRSMACLQDGKHEASYERRNARREFISRRMLPEISLRSELTLRGGKVAKQRLVLTCHQYQWQYVLQHQSIISVAITTAALEHYAAAQSFGHTIDASLRLSDEAVVPRLGPVPHPSYGRLLCGHRANAKVLIVTYASYLTHGHLLDDL